MGDPAATPADKGSQHVQRHHPNGNPHRRCHRRQPGLGRSTVLSLARRAWLHSLPIRPIVRQPKKLSPWWPKPVRRPSPCRSTSETRPPSMPSSIGCGNQA
ncbi:hypothetical protein [Lysobacter gummosus]|uniref:hypothetical protein n=1 Tax=Lysobacter gummosus TaxID=262324 RepID=UPI00363DC959